MMKSYLNPKITSGTEFQAGSPYLHLLKQFSVLICIIVSLILLVIASSLYPGGSLADPNSAGFDWTKNFISNLFAPKAINGMDNPSRIWAIIGMAFHSVGDGIFFIHMSKKIPVGNASKIIQLIGAVNILFTFLIATPLHDSMVTISSTLSLLGLFYITVFILKSKLFWLKVSCVVCLLIFYYTLFLYGSGNWGLLAVMQKISLLCSMYLVLRMEYFTKAEDFATIKRSSEKIQSAGSPEAGKS